MSNSTNKNLLLIIAVLLLTNIGVLGYFLWYKKSDPPVHNNDRERNGISEMLQKEVGFTEEQLSQYKLLKDKQREIIRPMYDDMRKSKDSLFRLLSAEEVDDSVLNQATNVIAMKQKALDLQTFYHFKRVRGLCKPDQEVKYDSMILRMFRKMGRPRSEQEKEKAEKKN